MVFLLIFPNHYLLYISTPNKSTTNSTFSMEYSVHVLAVPYRLVYRVDFLQTNRHGLDAFFLAAGPFYVSRPYYALREPLHQSIRDHNFNQVLVLYDASF